jgi:O-acetyl-ADP-ribose deacetylase (regulator of RNase III)
VIRVERGELADQAVAAVLRPVSAEWTAVTNAMRRLELAAGPDVDRQCRSLGDLPVGSAVVTSAGALAAEFMVHVVVRSVEQQVTRTAVQRALVAGLRRLEEWGIPAVAMPPLGTGAGNLDAEESADVMVPVLQAHLDSGRDPREVVIVVDSEYEEAAFRTRIERPAGVDGVPDSTSS